MKKENQISFLDFVKTYFPESSNLKSLDYHKKIMEELTYVPDRLHEADEPSITDLKGIRLPYIIMDDLTEECTEADREKALLFMENKLPLKTKGVFTSNNPIRIHDKETKTLRLFELFRGYGSQALALKKYGVKFENVGGCEIDKYADIAHEAIHGYVKNFGDITKVIASDVPDHDLCTYSFPCQSVSVSGKLEGLEEGSGTRSSLLWECRRIIEAKKPNFLMMENVKNLVSKKFKPSFDKWLSILGELGYNNYWKVINAKHCGIPQNRERVFCVSIRKDVDNGSFKFENDFDSGVRLKDVLENEVDDKYYLSDEMVKGFIEKSPQLGYINQDTQASKVITDTENFQTLCAGTHGYANGYANGYVKRSITILDTRQKSADVKNGKSGIRQYFDFCPCLTGTDYKDPKKVLIPDNQKVIEGCAVRGRNPENPKSRESGLSTVQMLEVNKDSGISNCLTTVQKDSLILENPPFRIRKLTPKECFRLMGVPDEDIDKLTWIYREEAEELLKKYPNHKGRRQFTHEQRIQRISNSQQYKLAGNSIVVDAMAFLKNLSNTECNSPIGKIEHINKSIPVQLTFPYL